LAVLAELARKTDAPLTPAANAAYLDLEKRWLTCSDQLTLGSGEVTDTLVFGGEPLPRAWFQEGLSPSLASAFDADESQATSLTALLAELRGKAEKVDEEASAYWKKLDLGKVGLYTTEQEADELSMELATKVGLSPNKVLKAYLELASAIERDFGAPTGLPDATECEALLAKGFRDEKGAWIGAPIGPLVDPHHANCYRVYNLYRESQTHAYEVTPRTTPGGDVSWADIQLFAEALTAENVTGTPAPLTQRGTPPPTTQNPGTTWPATPIPGSPLPSAEELSGRRAPTVTPGSKSGDDTTVHKPSPKPSSESDSGCNVAPGATNTSGSSAGIALACAALFLIRRRRLRTRPRETGDMTSAAL